MFMPPLCDERPDGVQPRTLRSWSGRAAGHHSEDDELQDDEQDQHRHRRGAAAPRAPAVRDPPGNRSSIETPCHRSPRMTCGRACPFRDQRRCQGRRQPAQDGDRLLRAGLESGSATPIILGRQRSREESNPHPAPLRPSRTIRSTWRLMVFLSLFHVGRLGEASPPARCPSGPGPPGLSTRVARSRTEFKPGPLQSTPSCRLLGVGGRYAQEEWPVTRRKETPCHRPPSSAASRPANRARTRRQRTKHGSPRPPSSRWFARPSISGRSGPTRSRSPSSTAACATPTSPS